ncbi:MAG: hypothetical protein BWZ08_02502 [candidate division BRC1 bacterium ADurb.BinA292]|nr:MAG: hypothetical protein BWZ08_02502 [candidate division BRC1 bacterium ADurb.BinA292]
MAYVDGFVLTVPKERLADYVKIARKASKVWMDHGALEVRECVGDDLDIKGMVPFPKLARAKPDETVIFSWIVFKSKADRNRVNAKVMKDPRIEKMMKGSPPFDCKRMGYGGFKMVVNEVAE